MPASTITNPATGSNRSIGTSAVQLTATNTPVSTGISIKAGNTNSGYVYVGFSSSVTAGTAAVTDGYELAAGQECYLPVGTVNNVNQVYVVASTTGQVAYFISN